jgi:hypothetical protein
MKNKMQSDLYKLLKRSYKKLKASVYFDKTQLVLRNKIVVYESTENSSVDERLEEIANLLSNQNDKTWYKFENDILSSVKSLTFPKKVEIKNDNTFIVNNHNENLEITKKQHFLDVAVEGQILGVLWVLLFGVEIDNSLYRHSYGNRLNKKLKDEENNKLFFSPYLFEPYFNQYESWRDKGLQCAQECLKNEQDVLILTMDFQSFFYSVHFSQEYFDLFYTNYKKEHEDSISAKRLNNFIFKVLKTYSSYFNEMEPKKYNNRIFLPIGFFPSNILSNWYLDKFDNEIIKKWNPLYYGRYVDDIIIVEKIEKNSPVVDFVNGQNDNQQKNKVIEYYMCNCRNSIQAKCSNNSALLIGDLKKSEDSENIKEIDNKNDNDEKGNENTKVTYTVNPLIFTDDSMKPDIKLQNDKVKLFYFDYKGSSALITCFRKEICKNKSEFRFLPEDQDAFVDDDYSEIYDIKYSDTPNKLRGVDGASIDKYAFSKFLGKYLRVGNLINDKKESKFEKDILKIFDTRAVMENYLSWEKVLLLFVSNNNINCFVKFVHIIEKSIETFLQDEKKGLDNVFSVKESLNMFLFSAVVKSLSHIWGSSVRKAIHEIENLFVSIPETEFNSDILYDVITGYRYNYCKTRMCDKYLLPVLIDTIIDGCEASFFSDDQNLNLSKLDCFMKNARNLDLGKTNYKYYPYMVTPQDITTSLTLDKIVKGEDILNNDEMIVIANDKCLKLNYQAPIEENIDLLENIECKHLSSKQVDSINVNAIRIGNSKKNRLKVAIANVRLDENNFNGVLNDTPNRSFDRYNNLSKVVNMAIKGRADILVLPENCVPFEWIPLLARISAKTKLAIITGIEHIKSKETMYNLTTTILPYTNKEHSFSYVSFHTKVCYSPDEKRQINGYGFKIKEGQSFDVFVWNDLWFSTYCCFELASIKYRSLFLSYVDLLAVVEWNRDVNYYSNIIESLSRDMHCYCVQVNSSNYGDSRITQPTKTELRDIIKTKGGINDTILIEEIDIESLRDFQLKEYELQNEDKRFKCTPPNFDKDIVKLRINGALFENLMNNMDS